jgi:hypothetical protein
MTSISPFFAIYSINPEIHVNIEDAIIGGEVVTTHERAYLIREEREVLDRH